MILWMAVQILLCELEHFLHQLELNTIVAQVMWPHLTRCYMGIHSYQVYRVRELMQHDRYAIMRKVRAIADSCRKSLCAAST